MGREKGKNTEGRINPPNTEEGEVEYNRRCELVQSTQV
jgi:hypothetical protein